MGELKNITLSKRDHFMPICQVKLGDVGTSGVKIHVSRYDGGVDLSGVGWGIKISTATNVKDTAVMTASVGEAWIVMDWVFPAIVASSVGDTTFELEGTASNGTVVWQSGKRVIKVVSDLDAEPTYLPEVTLLQEAIEAASIKVTALAQQVSTKSDEIDDDIEELTDSVSALQSQIETAEDSLDALSAQYASSFSTNNTQIAAINASITSINADIDELEAKLDAYEAHSAEIDASITSLRSSVQTAKQELDASVLETEQNVSDLNDDVAILKANVLSANNAVQTAINNANTASNKANSAASTANTVASAANTAAYAADTAAENARSIYNTVKNAYLTGEFKGETGPKGQKGDTGADVTSLQVVDSETILIPTISEMESDIATALAAAKASGEFKGDKGDKGDSYNLTSADKTEIAGQISTALTEDVTALKAEKADKTALAKTDDKLDALWKISEGQTYDVVDSAQEGLYNLPSGTKYFSVDEVMGKSVQGSTQGYQLFDSSKCVKDNSVYSITVDGDTVVCHFKTGGVQQYADIVLQDYITDMDAYVGKTIYVYVDDMITDKGQNSNFRVRAYMEDGTYVGIDCKNAKTWKSFTVPDNAVRIMVQIYFAYDVAPTEENYTTKYVRPYIGLTNTVSYEPYTGGIPSPSPQYPQEIADVVNPVIRVEGKNLFDMANAVINTGYWINATTGLSSANVSYDCVEYINCTNYVGRTVTLNKRPSGYLTGFAFYDADKEYISGIQNYSATANTPWTITVPQDAVYMRFTIPSGATDIQLEYGSTSSDFVPYESPTTYTLAYTLRSVGGVHDSVVINDDGTGSLVQRIDTKTLGSVEWDYSSPNGFISYNGFSDRKFTSYANLNMICDHYRRTNAGNISSLKSAGIVAFTANPNNKYVYVYDTDYTSVSELKSGVGDAIFQYELAEPIETALTDIPNLSIIPADHTVTLVDENGSDVSYMLECIRKLSEVSSDEE